MFSQQSEKDVSWYKFSNVTGYDSLFSYPVNLVLKDYTLFSSYKVPDHLADNKSAIRHLVLAWNQYYFSKYKQGKLSYSQLKKIAPQIDTTNLVDQELKNYISVLIYNTTNEKHLIFDTNYDDNFSNDQDYSFSLKGIEDQSSADWKKHFVPIRSNFEYVNGKEIINQNIELFVFPFKTPNLKITGIDNYFFEYTSPIKVLKANGPDSLQLYLTKNFIDTTEYVQVKIVGEDDKIRNKYYRSGNSFTYKNASYIIDSLDKKLNRISLKKINYEDSALAVGREINLFFSNHLSGLNQNGQAVSTNGYKGKYLLIDFWATWCIPCIESLPVLSEFFQTYNDRNLSLLSISIDDPSETMKVKQFIKDHKMVWDTMLPDEGSHSKASGFAQGGIPIFVLLNPEGRIVEVANGLFELPKIRAKLKNIL